VAWQRHLTIYYFIVISLAPFGSIFFDGSVLTRLCLLKPWITLINLVLLGALQGRGALLYRSYSLLQFGKYGRKEVTCYLMVKNAQLCRLLTKLSLILSCG